MSPEPDNPGPSLARVSAVPGGFVIDFLRPAAALAGAALALAALIAVVVAVAVHACARPSPPEAVLVPLAEVSAELPVAQR